MHVRTENPRRTRLFVLRKSKTNKSLIIVSTLIIKIWLEFNTMVKIISFFLLYFAEFRVQALSEEPARRR